MILYRCEVTTRNFHFEGFGSSAPLARQALLAGMKRHADEYPAGRISPDWPTETLKDAVTIKMVAGQAMRDRETI